jgi:hypothetical protein
MMTVDAVNGVAGQAIAPPVQPIERRIVDEAEADHFARLVEAREPVDADLADAPHGLLRPEAVEGAVTPTSATRSIGDALVDGIAQVKHDYDASFARINETLLATEGKEISMQQALKIQYELMQVGLQQELTAKLADKTSSGVQTLFRNQG